MFFGGATSKVDLHYDLDLPHIFITQFIGKKKIILFAPEYSKHLYRHPFTVSCNIDLEHPDFLRYPKLCQAEGYECEINNGETLFMPSGFWHYIYYEEGGFALSLRARPMSPTYLLRSGLKIFNLLCLDYGISRLLGAKRWYDIKEKMAVAKAESI
jgi:ribosomal protein L16 Arg81 hydroxylase